MPIGVGAAVGEKLVNFLHHTSTSALLDAASKANARRSKGKSFVTLGIPFPFLEMLIVRHGFLD